MAKVNMTKALSSWRRRPKKIRATRKKDNQQDRRITKMWNRLKPEIKINDQSLNGSTISNSGVIVEVLSGATNGIGQGLGDNNRIGDEIRLIGWNFSYAPYGNPAAVVSSQVMRVIVFFGKNENGILPLASDILANVGTTLATVSQRNWDERKKWTVIYDKSHVLAAQPVNIALSTQSGWMGEKHLKQFFKFKNKTVTYVDGVNNVENGGLYVLFISDSTTNPPVIKFNGRVYYTDS